MSKNSAPLKTAGGVGFQRMKKTNPFPGMNPWLELSWPDVHVQLVAYIRDALAPQLPPDLRARSEECVTLTDGEDGRAYRADVAVTESWRHGLPPQWTPETDATSSVVVAEPEIVPLEPDMERWVEIRERSGRLVTVIELLSPHNKGTGAGNYRRKQDDIIHSGVNLVEIDLLRRGEEVLRADSARPRPEHEWHYRVSVSRAAASGLVEIYNLPLRQRLPAFRVPLRATDRDVTLDLQPLIDRCYEFGAYWHTDYSSTPAQSLNEADAAWARGFLKDAGLI